MTSSRRFDRLLQAGCLGLIGMLAAAGCGGSSSPGTQQKDAGDAGPSNPEVNPGQGAMLTVNPPSIDFQTIDVGVKSAPMTVTVTNAGTAASGPIAVTVSGTGIVANGCSGQTLAKNATCTISVTVLVAAAGQFTGTIEVGDTALNTRKISVSGIAVPPGQFTLTPAPLDLGPVVAGKTATGTVVMTNIGTTGLSGIVINVTGTGFVAGTGTCTDALAVGTTCNIVVNFTAGATSGLAKGSLTVSQGGVTKSAALTAMVQTSARLVMTPLSAGLQTVLGTPSQPATFYVTNAGDLPSAVPTVTITGINKDDFKAESTCVTALAGNATASCQISVVYNPQKAPTTNSTATLTVSEGATGSSVTAALTGTAVPPSDLAISGTPVDLGEVVVGNTGAASTFTVTNNGGENSGVVEVTAAPGQFVIVANSCADKDLTAKGTPAATNTCTFTVAFKPAAGDVGVIAGQLKAKGATTLNPAFLAVSGNAVPAAKLVVDQKLLEFNSVPVGTKSPSQTLVVSNAGGAPTGLLKVDNSGAQFKVEGDTCSGLSLTAAGATKSCSITVSFTPTGTDVEATGSIIVTDTTGGAGSISASLHGTGTSLPAVAFDKTLACPQYFVDDTTCGAVDSLPRFTNTVVGKTTTNQAPFVVTNYTLPEVAPDSGTMAFAFSGEASADFSIGQNNCTEPVLSTPALAPKSTCAVTVAFKPSAAGLRKAVLTLTTSRGAVAKVTLEGKGLSAVELQPLNLGTSDKPKTGVDFPGVALGKNLGVKATLPYRLWVRDTSAADRTTTVSVSLPTPSLPDFVWPTAAGTLTITKDMVSPPGLGADFDAIANANPCVPSVLNLGADSQANTNWKSSGGYLYCDFGVQFYPQSKKGVLSADLTASESGGASSKLTLTGTATGALVVDPKPAALITEPVAIGMSSSIELTISNQGTTDQKSLTFGLSGTGAADFQIIKTDCWGKDGQDEHHAYTDLKAVVLPKDTDCRVWVGFTPQTEAKYSVTFTATAANGDGTADDETDSTTIIANGQSTYGSLEITPLTAAFGDVAEDSTTATPVTFTVRNTGTLNATALTVGVSTDYKLMPSTGVEGACNYENSSFILQGGKPCTIRVMPLPTSGAAQPVGAGKAPVVGSLTVSAKLGSETVELPAVDLTYNVTSSILVKDIDAPATSFATSMAYAFEAAGTLAKQTHKFEVKNIGSTAATLSAVAITPFTVIAGGDGLTPPACTYNTTASLAPNSSCTLVLQNDNITPVTTAALNYLTINDSGKSGAAKVLLSSPTLAPSDLIIDNTKHEVVAVDPPVTPPKYTTTFNLGTVPFGSSSASFVGGKATVWFKNQGKVKTEPLAFRWDVVAPTPFATGEVSKADPEFIIDSDETSCVNKALLPGETCSMTVHFTPNFVQRAKSDARTLQLNLIDSSASSVYVTFNATPTAAKSVYIEDVLDSRVGFYRLPDPAVALGTEGSVRQFRITNGNASSANATFTLPAAGTALCAEAANFFVATTQPASGGCVLGAQETLGASKPSCLVNIAFKPAARAPILQHAACAFGGATIGLVGHAQQPVTLEITQPTAFGTIGIGQTVSRTFTVKNIGDVGMTLEQDSLSVTVSPATFTVKADTSTCTGARLASNATCVVTVEATGAAAAPVAGTLTVTGGGTTKTADLAVTVVNAAVLTLTPVADGSFGTVAVTGSKIVKFTIKNAADAMPTGAVKPALSGSDQFSILNSDCLAAGLVASGECHVWVRFAPTALITGDSDLTATLSATADPGVGGGTVQAATPIALRGRPIGALTILDGVNPVTTIALANGTAVTVLTVQLASTASATAPLKTSLTGTDFMVVNDGCYGHVLNSGDTCPISVKYIGTQTATKKTATLTVDGGSAAKKASVEVTATDILATSH